MSLQRYLAVVECYSKNISKLVEKFNLFYTLPKAETHISITTKLKENFLSANKALNSAWELALKQLFPRKQLVFKTDASFRSAGFAFKNPDEASYSCVFYRWLRIFSEFAVRIYLRWLYKNESRNECVFVTVDIKFCIGNLLRKKLFFCLSGSSKCVVLFWKTYFRILRFFEFNLRLQNFRAAIIGFLL